MTVRTAQPGLVTGALGLVAGVLGLVFDVPLFGAVAGVLAMAAGVAGLILAQRLTAGVTDDDSEQGASGRSISPPRANRSPDDVAPDESKRTGPLAHANETLIDPATGLFSESFFTVTLEARIAAARRHLRPVSVVLLEVVDGLPVKQPKPVDIVLVAEIVTETLREADTACRLENGYLALLLEDTPENGAIWTVERIRRQLAEAHEGSTMWAGVACYPAHAFSPQEIMSASERALVSAREWRQDRIEVAVAAD